jgi:hypothetical protein
MRSRWGRPRVRAEKCACRPQPWRSHKTGAHFKNEKRKIANRKFGKSPTKRKSPRQKLSADLASISFSEGFEFVSRPLVRHCCAAQ